MPRRVAALLLTLASVAAGLVAAQPASAAPYEVQACLPGSEGPVASGLLVRAADGRAQGDRFRASDDCAGGIVAQAALRAGKPLRAGDEGSLTIGASKGTAYDGSSITKVAITRTINVIRPRYEYQLVARVGPTRRGIVLESCNGTEECTALSAKRTFDGTLPIGTRSVSVVLGCRPPTGRTCVRVPGGRAAMTVVVRALTATVDDQAPPLFDKDVTGDLVSPVAGQSGVRGFLVRGSDQSGLRSIAVVVDGQVRQIQPYNPEPCTDPTAGREVCPGSGTRAFAFDTALLRNGGHFVVLRLTDAVGNQTDSPAFAITTFNAAQTGPFDRITATLGRLGTRGAVTAPVAYGDPTTLGGTVLDINGTPLAGVKVQVSSSTSESYTATTDAAGAYGIPLTLGPSRHFVAVVSADGGILAGATSAKVEVEPVVELAVRRTGGSRVRITGSVPVQPRPAAGVRVDVQAFDTQRGSWRTFQPVTTRPDGTFATNYAFGNGGRFRLRALVAVQGGFPFSRGISDVAAVRIPR